MLASIKLLISMQVAKEQTLKSGIFFMSKKTTEEVLSDALTVELPGGKWIFGGIIAVLIIFGFVAHLNDFWASSYTSNKSSTSQSSSQSSGDVHGAWVYMQFFVEKRLKSPKSADFPFDGYRNVSELGRGRYRVNSYVDAQNSFGANIRTHFEGVIRKENDEWHLESLNFHE